MRRPLSSMLVFALVALLASLPLSADGPILDSECTLAWTAATSGSPPDGYNLLTGPSPGVHPVTFDVGLVTTIRCSEANINQAGQYYAVVNAYDAFGVSTETNEVSFILRTLAGPSSLSVGP